MNTFERMYCADARKGAASVEASETSTENEKVLAQCILSLCELVVSLSQTISDLKDSQR